LCSPGLPGFDPEKHMTDSPWIDKTNRDRREPPKAREMCGFTGEKHEKTREIIPVCVVKVSPVP